MHGYIEVSKCETIMNSSRPSGRMESNHISVKHGGVRRAIKILQKHKAEFSHYVDSVRIGRIAVYTVDNNDVYMSLRLKNYSKRNLKKIKQNLTLA